MKVCYIVGHKNPDTDSVASAIAYANLKRKEGYEAIPVIAGEPNKGTKYVLDKFEIEQPVTFDFTKAPEACVILVDHNEEGQRADGIVKEHVLEVIDHHRFAEFSSASPIYIRVQPVGSTSTIVTKMYQECKHIPEKHIASLLLSAILTDTLIFKSPTTTDMDMEMAKWLNEIVELDMEAHGTEILKAKSDISDMEIIDIINKDFKAYNFNTHAVVSVAVFETVNAEVPLARKDEFVAELKKIKAEKSLTNCLFAIVDIVNQNAYFLPTDSEDAELITKVFGQDEKDGIIEIDGIVSRKKQMIPPLEEYYAN